MSGLQSERPRYVLRAMALLAVVALGLASLLASDGGGGSSRVPPTVNYDVLPTTALVMSSSSANTDTSDAALGVAVGLLDVSWVPGLMIESVFPFTYIPYANEPCPGGGASSLSIIMATPGMFTAGDTYTLSFNGCTDAGVTLDGSLTMTLLDVGNLNALGLPEIEDYFIGSRLQLLQDNLAISDATGFLVADGDMTFSASDSPGYVQFSVTGASNAESNGLRTLRMTNYTLWTGTDLSFATHASTDYLLADTLLGGIIQAATPTPFTTAAGQAYPATGLMEVIGQNGNGVRLSALDSVNVLLGYEFDGNGDFNDYVRNSTWAAVIALTPSAVGVAGQPAPRHPALSALEALKKQAPRPDFRPVQPAR